MKFQTLSKDGPIADRLAGVEKELHTLKLLVLNKSQGLSFNNIVTVIHLVMSVVFMFVVLKQIWS